jgi:hypothetical protein
MLGDEAAVRAVVVVQLLAEVEHAVRKRVVEQAERQPLVRPGGDVEGDVLVERIAGAGVVAHGVEVAQAKAPPGAVHRARALAKAQIDLARLAAQVVMNPPVPPAEVIGLGRTVLGGGSPDLSVADGPGTEKSV